MLKLNTITKDVFAPNENDLDKVKLNEKTVIDRKDIISTGRLVACEYIGSMLNKNPNIKEKYNSRLENVDYAALDKKHKEKKLLFCAARVCKETGETAPQTFDEFRKNHARFAQDTTFLKVMAAIDRDILQPILFDVMDSVAMGLMSWRPVPFGGTLEVTVGSNDVFKLEDSAWGSGRSASKNYLYANTITLIPTMYACNATIKWYQDIVAGDAGRYYAALINGYYNKIYAKLLSTLNKAVADGTYIPAGLQASTYSTQNWLTITDKVAAVNGVKVDDLMAIGTRASLSALLPVDGTGGAIVGLQYGLGEEWFKNGFLPKAGSVDLFPVSPAVVPGTQNSTIDTLDTGANIYVVAKAGMGYPPMIGGYYEGTPITLTATPGGTGNAQGTADFTIEINFGATMDIQPVFASKVGVVTAVYSGD